MKIKIYLLIQTVWIENVPLSSTYSAYPDRYFAETVMDKLMNVNKNDSEFDTTYRIEEIDYYSQLEEVPVMRG